MIDCYLLHRSSCIRRKALEYKYHVLKCAWPGVENLLTAVLGIGEQGRELDDRHGLTDLVFPFLEHESEKVVRSALETAGMLMGAEGEGIYWKYLLDTRPCISKAAYVCIRKNEIHPGAGLLYGEQEKWRGSDETAGKCPYSIYVRRYLILLLIQENSWDRLPYLNTC